MYLPTYNQIFFKVEKKISIADNQKEFMELWNISRNYSYNFKCKTKKEVCDEKIVSS